MGCVGVAACVDLVMCKRLGVSGCGCVGGVAVCRLGGMAVCKFGWGWGGSVDQKAFWNVGVETSFGVEIGFPSGC